MGANAKPAREFRAHSRHFDGLVDHRLAYPQGRRLQGEALEAATDTDPVILVRLVSDEDSNSG